MNTILMDSSTPDHIYHIYTHPLKSHLQGDPRSASCSLNFLLLPLKLYLFSGQTRTFHILFYVIQLCLPSHFFHHRTLRTLIITRDRCTGTSPYLRYQHLFSHCRYYLQKFHKTDAVITTVFTFNRNGFKCKFCVITKICSPTFLSYLVI